MAPLPHYERVLFGKAPLRIVIAQMQFPLLFRFNEKPFLAAFQQSIQPDYPRISPELQVGLKFSSKGFENAGETLWRFSDAAGDWSVVLGESALTLESRRYTSVDDFLARFEMLLRSAVKDLGISRRTRIGLRYVNELRSEGAATLKDWAQLLNPKFVGFGGAPELLEGSVEQAFQQIQSRRDDGTLVIRHGLQLGTFVEPRPSDPPLVGPFYSIDLDYFDITDGPLDIAATIKQMRGYNETMYQFFRWSLDKGKLYSLLEPKPEL